MPHSLWLRHVGAPHDTRHKTSAQRLSAGLCPLPRAFLLLGALALLAGCGGENPTTAPSTPAVLLSAVGNSLNAKSCQKNGWQGLVTSTGSPFASETDCVSYGAKGGTLYKKQTITFNALAGKTFGAA